MTDQTAGPEIPTPEGDVALIETDYKIGQDNVEGSVGPFGFDVHNPVFLVSGLAVVAFVIYALALPEQANAVFGWLRPFLTSTFDWFFLGAANIFVIFCLLLIISPWGSVRLGGKEATPDYSYIGWFSMLFAAGMGIGLMFFGVLEPVYYFGTPWGDEPLGAVRPFTEDGALIEGNIAEARRMALAATSYHWALHPWAIYAVVALSLALFTYNKGLPLSIRSAFYPLLGERVWGWWGHIIDTLAVFATLFGLATSLGFGAEQTASGLTFLFGSGDAADGTRAFLGITYGNSADSGVENNPLLLVLLISAITAVALVSVVRGLDGGVKVLSEINMGLAALLLLFVFLVGGPIFLITLFFDSIWAYLTNVVALSNPVGRADENFMQGWTSFYWAWWISWSPFVGMFIARVSRGRTVLNQVVADGYTGAQDAALELKLFKMLAELPLATITSVIGIILVIVFFVTSSDSGSLVIDTITAGGKVDAPVSQRVFWCIFEGAVAIVLL